MYQRMRRSTAIWILLWIVVALLAAGSDSFGLIHIPRAVLTTTRWLVLAGLVFFAALGRSLVTWIFVSMLVGAEIGYDFPRFALDLRLLAQIFLRLIEVIIAPLVFSTLVSGIAAHSDRWLGQLKLLAFIGALDDDQARHDSSSLVYVSRSRLRPLV